MTTVLWNIVLVLVFVLIGGVFAAAEISLVSLRESQLRALAERGERGARVASLAADSNRFLSAVQIGVTLAGFLSAAFGGATLSEYLAPVFERIGLSSSVAGVLALVVVTGLISYASILLGELVPKRVGLQRTEAVALALAPLVDRISKLTAPVVWLLGRNADFLVRVLGADPHAQRGVMSEEELRDLVAGHEALDKDERQLITDVFNAGDRQLREVMVPRTEVDFLDATTPVFRAARVVSVNSRSRYPVVRGNADDVVGFVHVRDLLAPDLVDSTTRVGELARNVMLLPGSKRVLPALSEMRRASAHLAIVIDEYGGTAGIVTLEDLVEELVGEIRDEYDVTEEERSRRLRGGDIEVDGLLNLEDFAELTGLALPEGPYETVAGFVVSQLGHLAANADAVDVDGHTLTVVEMDGRRIARVRVAERPGEGAEEPAEAVAPIVGPPASDPAGRAGAGQEATAGEARR